MSLDRPSADAAERCYYCPRMCRFSCPVSHELPRETLTPWGKMTQLHLSSEPRTSERAAPLLALVEKARKVINRKSAQTLDPGTAESFYACSGCLRCRSFCEHENDVPRALYQGRAEAVAQGVAPAAATAEVDRFMRNGHVQASDPSLALNQILSSRKFAIPQSSSVLFAGCEAAVNQPAVVEAALDASEALGVALPLTTSPVCCGRPLLEAGHRDAFREHVAKAWEQLGEREIVSLSAPCARTLSEWAREVGVAPKGPVVHVSTFLARRLGPEIRAQKLPGNALYHDSCHLARGMGEYDAPRRLLQAALDGGVVEAADSRERSDCCGATGLLPKTFPNTARAMAMSRADALREAGGDRIASSCPACEHSLKGAGLEVRSVVEIVAEWLVGKRESVVGPEDASGAGTASISEAASVGTSSAVSTASNTSPTLSASQTSPSPSPSTASTLSTPPTPPTPPTPSTASAASTVATALGALGSQEDSAGADKVSAAEAPGVASDSDAPALLSAPAASKSAGSAAKTGNKAKKDLKSDAAQKDRPSSRKES